MSEQYEDFKLSKFRDVWLGVVLLLVVATTSIMMVRLDANFAKHAAKLAEQKAKLAEVMPDIDVPLGRRGLPLTLKILNVVMLVGVAGLLAYAIWDWRASAVQPPFGF